MGEIISFLVSIILHPDSKTGFNSLDQLKTHLQKIFIDQRSGNGIIRVIRLIQKIFVKYVFLIRDLEMVKLIPFPV